MIRPDRDRVQTRVRALAGLPAPRRRAAEALLHYLRDDPGRGIQLSVELDRDAYAYMTALGYGPTACERACLDLLASGEGEAAASVPPTVSVAATRGAGR
jgi:hypothetical protein